MDEFFALDDSPKVDDSQEVTLSESHPGHAERLEFLKTSAEALESFSDDQIRTLITVPWGWSYPTGPIDVKNAVLTRNGMVADFAQLQELARQTANAAGVFKLPHTDEYTTLDHTSKIPHHIAVRLELSESTPATPHVWNS